MEDVCRYCMFIIRRTTNDRMAEGKFCLLKCRSLEVQACFLVNAEHDVHVLHSLTYSSLQEIVDHACHYDLATKHFSVHNGFVGVDHLLEVWCLVGIVGKSSVVVILFVELCYCIGICGAVEGDDLCAEDASRKVAAVWNEVDSDAFCLISFIESVYDIWSILGAQFVERLRYFMQVLVREQFVY